MSVLSAIGCTSSWFSCLECVLVSCMGMKHTQLHAFRNLQVGSRIHLHSVYMQCSLFATLLVDSVSNLLWSKTMSRETAGISWQGLPPVSFWLQEIMGVLIGSAVIPIAMCLMWKKTNKWGAMGGAVFGQWCGLIAWLVFAKVKAHPT